MPNTTLNDFVGKPKKKSKKPPKKKPKKGPRKARRRTSKGSIKSFITKKLKGTEKEIERLEAKGRLYPHERTALNMLRMQAGSWRRYLREHKKE